MTFDQINAEMARKQDLLNGVWAAVLTPMYANLSCNYEQLSAHCFDMIANGCAGVVLFGTTGEGPSFSVAERKEALEKLVSLGFDPKKIILGNGSSCILDTVALARETLRYHATFLVAPPCYYKNVSDDGVIAFYREVIQRVADPKLRILLYHIPQMTGVPISLQVVRSLCREFPDIVIGIKESEGNLSLTRKILEELPHFKVFVAKGTQIIEATQSGGAGAICGMASLYPELICSLYQQGLKANVPNPKILSAITQAFEGIPFIPAAKALMEKRQGVVWHAVRPPLAPLHDDQKRAFFSNLDGGESCTFSVTESYNQPPLTGP